MRESTHEHSSTKLLLVRGLYNEGWRGQPAAYFWIRVPGLPKGSLQPGGAGGGRMGGTGDRGTGGQGSPKAIRINTGQVTSHPGLLRQGTWGQGRLLVMLIKSVCSTELGGVKGPGGCPRGDLGNGRC